MLYIVTTSKAHELELNLGQLIRDHKIPHQLVPYQDSVSIPATAPGDVVFILGSKAWKGVGDLGLVKKNLTFSSHRGLAIPWGEGWITPGPDPYAASVDHKTSVELKLDLCGAIRLHNTGTLMPVVGDYQYVDDLSQFIETVQLISQETGAAVPISVDLETVGLDEWNPDKHIVCIQLSHTEGKTDIVYFDGPQDQPVHSPPWEEAATSRELVWRQIEWLLNSEGVKTRGANLKFDLRWMRHKWGIECANYSMDTTLVGSLIDENRSNSLNTHAKWYTPIGGYDDPFNRLYDKSRMDLVPREDMRIYGGGDTDACLRVSNKMIPELSGNPRLHNFYLNLLQPANKEMVNMEMEGVLIDKERFAELGNDLQVEIDRLQLEAEKLMPGRMVAKMGDKGLKLSRPAVISSFMFSDAGLNLDPLEMTKSGKAPSTAYTHLIKFQDNERAAEFIDIYKQFNSATKTLSTYVTGFLKHLRHDDRFHATYILYKGDHDGGESGTNCLPLDELVLTSRGYLPAGDVRVGDQLLTHRNRARPVCDVIDNGVKPIVAVGLETHALRTTENHQYLTTTGWVAAGDLTLGAEVIVYGHAEEWRPIPEWEEYEVSTWGRVRRADTKRLRKQYPKGRWGHLKVTVSRNGAQKRKGGDKKDISVHRLVASAFIDNPQGLPEVRHRNGVAFDNSVQNLCWSTRKANAEDAVGHGTMYRGGQSGAKLSWKKVARIRNNTGELSDREWAKEFKCSRELIRDVRLGYRWVRKLRTRVTNWRVECVQSISYQEAEQTVGLTVEADHSHVTSGVVTHNTGRLACKEPAMQCMTGDTAILTDQGYRPLLSVCQWIETGRSAKVLTHLGKWMPISHIHRNGKKLITTVKTRSGREINCTSNHPVLVDGVGFVRADELKVGDVLYGTLQHKTRTKGQGVHQSRLLFVDGDEKPMYQHVLEGLGKLRWPWHWNRRKVDDVRGVYGRHGGEAQGDNAGEEGCEWPLHSRQLYLGDPSDPSEQSPQYQGPYAIWQDAERGAVGGGVWAYSGMSAIQDGRGIDFGRSVDAPACFVHARAAGFQKDPIVSIRHGGYKETFDLTVAGAHSFVAEGLVVHNTLPKHTKWAKRLRECYVPPEDHLMFEVDFSQGELRVTACVANEPTMLQSYHNNMDLHIVAGAMACGIPIESALALQGTKDKIILPSGTQADFKFIRQNGKAANFGLIYGMGAEGYVSYARDSYGVKMSVDDAWSIRSGFFGLYDRLDEWHRVYKEFAHENGFVVSPLGRVRHLPNINHYSSSLRSLDERRAINAPIQSTLSDMTLLALVELRRRYGHNIPLKPCMAVHDAILGYVPKEETIWVHRLVEVMETLPLEQVFGWKPQITFTAEPEIGPDLGHLKELHLPAA